MSERAVVESPSRGPREAASGGGLRALAHAGAPDATPVWARTRDDVTEPDDLDEARAEEVARLLLASPPTTGGDDGGGDGPRALPDTLRRWAERLTGADLGAVRLRREPSGRAAVRRRGARALAHGSDIVLGGDVGPLSTGRGLRVLAHELGHLVRPPWGGRAGRLAAPQPGPWRAELAPEGLEAVRSWLPGVLEALARVELGDDLLRGWDAAARQSGAPTASLRPAFVAVAAANGVAVLGSAELRAVELGPADRVAGPHPAAGTVELVDLATGVSGHLGTADQADGGVRPVLRAAGARRPNDEFRPGQSVLVVHVPGYVLTEGELGRLNEEVRGSAPDEREPRREEVAGEDAGGDAAGETAATEADAGILPSSTRPAAEPGSAAETGSAAEPAEGAAEPGPAPPDAAEADAGAHAEREQGAPTAAREQTLRAKRAADRARRRTAAGRVPAWASRGESETSTADVAADTAADVTAGAAAASGGEGGVVVAAGAAVAGVAVAGVAAGALDAVGSAGAADAAEVAAPAGAAVARGGASAAVPATAAAEGSAVEPAAAPSAGAAPAAGEAPAEAESDAAADAHEERLDSAEDRAGQGDTGSGVGEDAREGDGPPADERGAAAADGVGEADGAADAAPPAADVAAAASHAQGPSEPAQPAYPEPSAGPSEADAASESTASESAESQRAASEEHADSVRAADAATDERDEERTEEAIDAGDTGAAAPTPAADGAPLLEGLAEPVDAGGAESGAESGAAGGPGGAGPGGGGGDAAPVAEAEPAPETAGMDPEAGLAAASQLQPVQAAQALGGVGGAIDATAEAEGERLQGELPVVEVGGDGSGGTAVVAGTASGADGRVSAVDGGGRGRQQQPEPTPEPGPAPTAGIVAPVVADSGEGTVRREDAERVAGMVDSMPTTDPTIDTSAGPSPTLQKTGDADPANMREQRSELDTVVAEQTARGAADVAAPAGERDVRDRSPRVAVEHPAITRPGGQAAEAVPAGDEAVGVIAEEKSGAGVRAAVASAQGEVVARREEHREQVAEEKANSDAEIAAAKEENAAQQKAEKVKVARDVGKARADWTAEQRATVDDADEKAKKALTKGDEEVARAAEKGDKDAAAEIAKGEKEAAAAKADAEREAAEKKREAERKKKEDSGGIFGWIASKVTSFFTALKNAVTKVFDAAKKLVKKAIEAAKKLAMAVIDRVRDAVIGLIKAVGAALIALGDIVLAAFPALKRKWRALIEKGVRAAEDAVNRLADALKKSVAKLLDALGKAFDFLLDTLKKGMLAALTVAQGVVMAAVNAAKAIAEALGEWVTIIVDVARAPGRWVRNLAASASDGVRNHLWKAFVTAVKEWFNAKLEEVLGVGMTIWGVLAKGGLAIGAIGAMAFEALKTAIPPALIQLIIEKVVAMIVPAVGAVLAIIEGLQAAWGTVKRILAAFGKFLVFLKAVGKGPAGPQFAELLAAAAIVVIDFVANWLLKRLRKPASKVAGKLKAIAKKILARLKKALKKVGRAIQRTVRKVVGRFRTWQAKRQAKKDRKAGKDPRAEAAKRKRAKEEAKRKKLERAVTAIRPQLGRLLGRGISAFALSGTLVYLRIRHGLSSLRRRGAEIVAKVNPDASVAETKSAQQHARQIAEALIPVLREVLAAYDEDLMAKGETRDQIEDVSEQILRPTGVSTSGRKVIPIDELRSDVQEAALRRAAEKAGAGKGDLFGVTRGAGSAGVALSRDEVILARAGHGKWLSRLEVQALGGPYSRIARFLGAGADRLRLGHASVLGAVTGSRPEQRSARIAALAASARAGGPMAAFERRLRRMSVLGSLEAARLPEAAIAMQIAGGVASKEQHARTPEGTAGIEDLYGPQGSKAPATPTGAASQPSHPEHAAGTASRDQRVGEIVRWLITEIRADLVINDGFTAGPLIDAIRKFLHDQHSGASAAKLKSALMGFLKSRSGL